MTDSPGAQPDSVEVLQLPPATFLATLILGSSMWLGIFEAVRWLIS